MLSCGVLNRWSKCFFPRIGFYIFSFFNLNFNQLIVYFKTLDGATWSQINPRDFQEDVAVIVLFFKSLLIVSLFNHPVIVSFFNCNLIVIFFNCSFFVSILQSSKKLCVMTGIEPGPRKWQAEMENIRPCLSQFGRNVWTTWF